MLCMHRQCLSVTIAECVTKKLLVDAGMNGIEVFSLGTLDWGENPRPDFVTQKYVFYN